MATEQKIHSDYTVGWVCALSKEQTAATAMLDRRHLDLPKPPTDHNTYTLGSIGDHNIVIACLPEGQIDTNSAATVATRMISTFASIKFGLMVGIAGGIPPKVRLGDVVVSTPSGQYSGVVQWDLGKATEGGQFERTGALNHAPTSLRTALGKLKSAHEMNGPKIPEHLEELGRKWPRLAPKYLRSTSLEDVLFKSNYAHASKSSTDCDKVLDKEDEEIGEYEDDEEAENCQFCDKTKIVKRKARDMKVHYGLIASGNKVIKNARFRDKLNRDLGGNVLCVEMAAAGLMNKFPCLIIRGICDYSDSHKNKNWQEHAAAVAAAFAKELLEHTQSSDVDGEQPVQKILADVVENVEAINGKLDVNYYNEILEWLAPHDYFTQHRDYFARREEGTGQWLLDSEEYKAWWSEGQRTLFCPGIPGGGKTILTSIVINNLISMFGKQDDVGLAYIYCDFRKQDTQSTEVLIKSLLRQLTGELSSLPDCVSELYNRRSSKQAPPTFRDFSASLQSVAAMFSRVFVIVDALDECKASDGGWMKLLPELSSLQKICRVNIFMTSRLIPDIQQLVLEKFQETSMKEISATESDVRRYLDGRIHDSWTLSRYKSDIQENIKSKILEATSGMFLLGKLHLDSLQEEITPKGIHIALEKLRCGSEAYYDVYDKAMERINGQMKGHRNLALGVLSWITSAKRELTTSELQHALAAEVGEDSLDEDNVTQVDDMISVCAGLVTVDEESDVIRLVHYTTLEYFQRTKSRWFPDAEADIAKICATYLSFSIFEAGCCETDDEFEDRLRQNKLYDYAANNWGHHARHDSKLIPEHIKFLESEGKIEAASQALMAVKVWPGETAYSQSFAKKMTALHLTAYFGVETAVKIFLKKCTRIDARNTHDRTPLSLAAESGHEAIIELLLEKGAEIDARDNNGQTPLSLAAESGHEAIIELLLEKGAEIDARDNNGQTPLSLAAQSGYKAVVELLLEKGAEIDAGDNYSRTPLSLAAQSGHKAVVELLLEKGAEIDTGDNYSWTPLSRTTQSGHKAVVELLLEKGAEIDLRDNGSQTPLSYAGQSGHEVVVQPAAA